VSLALLLCGACGAPQPRALVTLGPGGLTRTTITRLGEERPAGPGASARDQANAVDQKPLVLWSGDSPAAVVAYRLRPHLAPLSSTQRFLDLLGASGSRAFPISYRATLDPRATTEESLDLVLPDGIVTADVDGDGTDELVLVRGLGGVDVWSRARRLFRYPSPTAGTGAAKYVLRSGTVARLPGRAVVFLLFSRKVFGDPGPEALRAAGATEPFAVLRVDQRGVHRLRLEGLGEAVVEVLAVGALNRPGSREVDELLIVSARENERGQRVAHLSRHRADGSLLGPARAVEPPLEPWDDAEFMFLPQSDRAVAWSRKLERVYFLAPDQPAGGVRSVALRSAGIESVAGGPRLLSAVSGPDGTWALVQVKERVYAIDEAGTCFAAAGGSWQRLAAPGPFYRAEPPGPDLDLVGLFASPVSPDEFLVVHARPLMPRTLGDDELWRAAKRFLPLADLDYYERRSHPKIHIDGDAYRDHLEAERRERGVTEPVNTAEDWRRLLPRTWAEAVARRRVEHEMFIYGALTEPLVKGVVPKGYRDTQAYRAWLQTLRQPAATTFTLVRHGTAVTRFQIDAVPQLEAHAELAAPLVAFRTRGATVTLVLPLAGPPASPLRAGFYLVRSEARGR
jgi:hypothetical protein